MRLDPSTHVRRGSLFGVDGRLTDFIPGVIHNFFPGTLVWFPRQTLSDQITLYQRILLTALPVPAARDNAHVAGKTGLQAIYW